MRAVVVSCLFLCALDAYSCARKNVYKIDLHASSIYPAMRAVIGYWTSLPRRAGPPPTCKLPNYLFTS